MTVTIDVAVADIDCTVWTNGFQFHPLENVSLDRQSWRLDLKKKIKSDLYAARTRPWRNSFAQKLNLTWIIVHGLWTTFVIGLSFCCLTAHSLSLLWGKKMLWDIQNFTYVPRKEKVIQVWKYTRVSQFLIFFFCFFFFEGTVLLTLIKGALRKICPIAVEV